MHKARMSNQLARREGCQAPNKSGLTLAPTHPALQLQRAIGNQRVLRQLEASSVPPQLTIGKPGDAAEREADTVADHAVRASGVIPPASPPAGDAPPEPGDDLGARLKSATRAGRSLDGDTRTGLESAVGADLSAVRIHTSYEATQLSTELGARAFTRGSDIYFNRGRFNPGTREGRHLLAHEAAHVAQQSNADVSSIRRQPDKTLEDNAKRDAAALLTAFKGVGTKEDVVYRILAQAPGVVRAVKAAYNQHSNVHTGKGLVADLRYEFEADSKEEWLFVVGQLQRAGINVPGLAVKYVRHDPNARTRIVATPNVLTAVPGTKITYHIDRGQELHAPGSYYSYQWNILNDPVTSKALGQPVKVTGSTKFKIEAIGKFPGNHKVVCRVTYHPKGGEAGTPKYYEFPQTVIPEAKAVTDALKAAPESADPAKELEILEAFLKVLVTAGSRDDTAPLDPVIKKAYEKQIAAMKKRLASTAGKSRIPIKAVHLDRERGTTSPLKAFLTRNGAIGTWVSWTLVDITNPMSRRLTGEYTGIGRTDDEAIRAAIADWDSNNRYYTGRIKLRVDAKATGTEINREFQTDGQSFWDSVSEFFKEVGFWAGIGAIGLGVVTAIAPVPGSRVVSGLIWTSIVASSAAAVIDISQRHAEGVSSGKEDALDVLTVVGNVLAGTWMKGAKVVVGRKHGSKIMKGILIGQVATDGMQGIIITIDLIAKYDEIMKIRDPKKRTEALMELFRSAATVGLMIFVSAKSTKHSKTELDRLGMSKAKLKNWDKYDPDTNAAFKKRLFEFRGDHDVFPHPGYRGGEGQLFLSPLHPGRTLKRWWQGQLTRMPRSVRRLIEARSGVDTNPQLAKDIEVVQIHEQGSDWILRDFDPRTVELPTVLGRSAAARQKLADVIAILDGMVGKNEGTKTLLKRLKRDPPSVNIHWSEAKQKLVVIDLE